MDRAEVAGKIQVVIESVEQLRRLANLPREDFDHDLRNLDSAEHRLQISIEALMDIGAYLIGSLGLATPKRHADIPAILTEAGEFPPEAVATFQTMVSFRNRVVHLYNRIDVDVVWDILQNHIDDLPRFLNWMLEAVDRHPTTE